MDIYHELSEYHYIMGAVQRDLHPNQQIFDALIYQKTFGFRLLYDPDDWSSN